MHILIDSGSYHALNLGDVAAAGGHFAAARTWPGASIAAVTTAAGAGIALPGVRPVPLAGRIAFRPIDGSGAPIVCCRRLRDRFNAFHDRIRRRWPADARRGDRRQADGGVPARLLRGADYCRREARGSRDRAAAGVFTDAFAENANRVLTRWSWPLTVA
jgi:hypothetical protein